MVAERVCCAVAGKVMDEAHRNGGKLDRRKDDNQDQWRRREKRSGTEK